MISEEHTVEEQAVVDRMVEDRQAVLLVGETARELLVPVSALPAGTQPGMWLKVEFDGDQLISATIDEEYTQQVLERVKEKLAQLRKRGRSRHENTP
jgi:hypothetical protein